MAPAGRKRLSAMVAYNVEGDLDCSVGHLHSAYGWAGVLDVGIKPGTDGLARPNIEKRPHCETHSYWNKAHDTLLTSTFFPYRVLYEGGQHG